MKKLPTETINSSTQQKSLLLLSKDESSSSYLNMPTFNPQSTLNIDPSIETTSLNCQSATVDKPSSPAKTSNIQNPMLAPSGKEESKKKKYKKSWLNKFTTKTNAVNTLSLPVTPTAQPTSSTPVHQIIDYIPPQPFKRNFAKQLHSSQPSVKTSSAEATARQYATNESVRNKKQQIIEILSSPEKMPREGSHVSCEENSVLGMAEPVELEATGAVKRRCNSVPLVSETERQKIAGELENDQVNPGVVKNRYDHKRFMEAFSSCFMKFYGEMTEEERRGGKQSLLEPPVSEEKKEILFKESPIKGKTLCKVNSEKELKDIIDRISHPRQQSDQPTTKNKPKLSSEDISKIFKSRMGNFKTKQKQANSNYIKQNIKATAIPTTVQNIQKQEHHPHSRSIALTYNTKSANQNQYSIPPSSARVSRQPYNINQQLNKTTSGIGPYSSSHKQHISDGNNYLQTQSMIGRVGFNISPRGSATATNYYPYTTRSGSTNQYPPITLSAFKPQQLSMTNHMDLNKQFIKEMSSINHEINSPYSCQTHLPRFRIPKPELVYQLAVYKNQSNSKSVMTKLSTNSANAILDGPAENNDGQINIENNEDE